MKKQVLFFIESLQCGGAEKSIISLLPLLDYSKMDVDLLLSKRGCVFEQYVPKDVQILDLEAQARPMWYKVYQMLFSFQLRWNRLIGKYEYGSETRWRTMRRAYTPLKKHYDVAIAYQQGWPTYYIIDKVTADKKITWINSDITQAGYSMSFNRPFYDKYDIIVPVSDRLKGILEASGYVPTDRFYPVSDIVNPRLVRAMALQPQTAINNRGWKLVTVGRMVRVKGYDMAVEAAKILRESGLQFCWYFVGDGTERKSIEAMINMYDLHEYVFLLGEQANPYPYINACDIYIQTSRNEGFGITIAEAKILRKPVISTNFLVVHDQIRDEQNGLIAEMNAQGITHSILRMVNDQQLRETIVCNLQDEHNDTAKVESAKVNALICS